MAIKPTDQEIGKLYREAGPTGPSDELDRNILMAARAAVENNAATTWWSRWRLPLQAVATICLVVMVTTMIERREPSPPAIPPLAMNDDAATADKQQVAPATSNRAPAVAESKARMADQAPARLRSEAQKSAPGPAPAAPAQDQVREAVRSSPPAENSIAAESAAAPLPKPEAAAAPSAKGAARMAADQAMAPKEWLNSIQALINQNRLEEARKRLAAFVHAYPSEVVPEGIRAKLKAAPDGDRAKQP